MKKLAEVIEVLRHFIIIAISTFVILAGFPFNTAADDLINCVAFKITLVSEGQEIEWEYENPDGFEYEVGSTVIKGQNAKEEVEKMYNALQLTKSTEVEEIKQILEKQGYDKLEKFVVRLKYFDEELLTWSWVR
ncbi:MAG TPA: hypothetical protein GX497_05810 [Bacillus bacterium]|nr:hypothetical protein [Bacillus sp. (in: firmicutes)]